MKTPTKPRIVAMVGEAVRYPMAEDWAQKVRLPTKSCEVTRELYGYSAPTLDTGKLAYMMDFEGFSSDERQAAMAILDSRMEALVARAV